MLLRATSPHPNRNVRKDPVMAGVTVLPASVRQRLILTDGNPPQNLTNSTSLRSLHIVQGGSGNKAYTHILF